MRSILTYHSIDDSRSPISVSEEAFVRHVEILSGEGITVLPLHELLAADDDVDAVAITFDDGFENLASVAWPRLRDAGLPATVFVVSGRTGTDNRWGGEDEDGIPSLPLLADDAIGRLADEGLELGGHSRTHRKLSGLAAADLADEIGGCRADIEQRFGVTPFAYCYPYGAFDDAAVDVAREHYSAACTTEFAALENGVDTCRLPRLDMYYFREGDRLTGYGSGSFQRFVARRAWLRRVRARAERLIPGETRRIERNTGGR